MFISAMVGLYFLFVSIRIQAQLRRIQAGGLAGQYGAIFAACLSRISR
ncbi:hypothetical protein M495_05115 [Serratia liquefaciens ATCC 27592]|nr:hypothetical protein M495_05115 [Serratia liquefaciens ATCC 27592]